MSIERELEKEEDALAEALEEGRIDQKEYNAAMHDLQREARLAEEGEKDEPKR